MAVTKMHTPEEINEAIAAGATDAGENRVQELVENSIQHPCDIHGTHLAGGESHLFQFRKAHG